MKIKKILAMTLLCAICLAAVSACGASHKDWEDIGPNGKMVIGVTPNPPMNYQDENGGWTLGFDTEFAIAVCEILGVTAVFQEIDWDAKTTELNAKNIDAVWNGMTITAERAKEMDISTPYMSNSQVLVARSEDEGKYKDIKELDGVKVVYELGSTLEETVVNHDFFAKAEKTGVDKQITGFLEVKSGTADVTLVDITLAKEMLQPGGDYDGLVYIEIADFKEEFGIAFRKNSPDTLKKVNDAIKQLIDNGKLLEIAEKYELANALIK